MKITSHIKSSYEQHWHEANNIIIALSLLVLLFGICLNMVNAWVYQYSGISFGSHLWPYGFVPLMLYLGHPLIADEYPRVSRFFHAYSLYFLTALAIGFYTEGIQFTPYAPVDHILLVLDTSLGFSLESVIAWFQVRPTLFNALEFIYLMLAYQMVLTPLFLWLLNYQHALYIYFISELIAVLFGWLIYYYLPSSGPIAVLSPDLFKPDFMDLLVRYNAIHEYGTVMHDTEGLISFPSFHVIFALLVVYAFKQNRWIFYPLLTLNFLQIISTVAIGKHYLVDVIGGALIAWLAIQVANQLLKKKEVV